MTIIESKKTIGKPIADAYTFLADLNNHQQLMPENIYNWSSTATEARFTIQNMAKLALKVGSLLPNQQVQIVPAETPPFELELKWIVAANGDSTDVTYQISADLNMMMKMLASGPLQKLADHETARLAEVLK
ncbi:SRPBCC family protein [Mucilaginibacter sp. AW1-3]